MLQKLTYLALALSIIALVVSGLAYGKAGGIADFRTRLEASEQKANELEARVETEVQARENELETQARLLEARGEMLQAETELEINENYEAAVEAMERAQERLAEARTTANEVMQARIDELNTEIDTLKKEAQEKAVETIDNLQMLLKEWEVRLSGSGQ
jgi:Skp family chaperone for outer membrane proteins